MEVDTTLIKPESSAHIERVIDYYQPSDALVSSSFAHRSFGPQGTYGTWSAFANTNRWLMQQVIITMAEIDTPAIDHTWWRRHFFAIRQADHEASIEVSIGARKKA